MGLKIFVDLHFSDMKNGLYTDMGSEGRWGTRWAKLLSENGHEVHCLSGSSTHNSYSPNLIIECGIRNEKYDVALLPGPEIPPGIKAYLYMFMHFSPCTLIPPNNLELYNPDNHIVVYPFITQFRYPTNPENRFEHKTYFMPTPIAERFEEPSFERLPSIVWTDRWGPALLNDMYFNAMIKLSKKHNLHTKILCYQNFYHHIVQNEREGKAQQYEARRLKEKINSLSSFEGIESVANDKLIEILKTIKFALNTHNSGMGGSMTEQVTTAAFPLPAGGTRSIFPHIDSKLYDTPYPNTVDEVVKNWEIPMQDESFYVSSIKEYQKDLEPHLYKNCLNQFYYVLSKNGFNISRFR